MTSVFQYVSRRNSRRLLVRLTKLLTTVQLTTKATKCEKMSPPVDDKSYKVWENVLTGWRQKLQSVTTCPHRLSTKVTKCNNMSSSVDDKSYKMLQHVLTGWRQKLQSVTTCPHRLSTKVTKCNTIKRRHIHRNKLPIRKLKASVTVLPGTTTAQLYSVPCKTISWPKHSSHAAATLMS